MNRFGSSGRNSLVLCGALFCCLAQAQNPPAMSGRTRVLAKDSAAERVVRKVYEGSYSYVRIERAEPGAAPSQHPVVIAPEALRAALASLNNARVKDETLFDAEELAEIVPPLVRALGEVRPDQDVSFAVSGKHSGWGPLAPRSVTTARVFRTAEGLQLIVGLVQLPFESEYIASGYLLPFEPGRRAAPVDKAVVIAPATGTARRADWVTLALAAAPAVAATAGTPPAAGPVAAAPPAAQAAAAPAAAVAPPVAAAVPAVPAPPRDAAFFEEQEARLRTLKRLRDSGLISEDEYQQKKREVLSTL
jgi:hypothetical protein